MICERLKELLPEYLAGALDEASRGRVLQHLDDCASCRVEVARLDTVWQNLDLLNVSAEPSPALRPRFEEMLAAYQCGVAARGAPVRRSWFASPFPAWAAAACALVLILSGVAVGRFTSQQGASERRTEYSQLKGEIESMRQLVTLSLLEQQSSGARLRGVNYSYRMERPDSQVESALLYAVNNDVNVNVRLSALDALQKFAGTPRVSRALLDGLATQDSPLVQIGLIDFLVARNETDAAPALKNLADNPQTNPAVRQRAQWGLNKLGAA